MKKKLLNLVLALTLVTAGLATGFSTAAAKEADGLSYNWDVTYSGKSFTSTYDSEAAKIKNAMPGDTITYSVKYINSSTESADFYMNADVVKSLEQTSKGEGGAYSFKITNNDEIIFDSETVGGDVTEAVGLNQVNGKEGAYFALGSVPVNGSGTVSVLITLDGTSQTNNYMAATANLNIVFGAEATSTAKYSKTIIKKIPKEDKRYQYVTVNETKPGIKQVSKTNNGETEVVAIDDSAIPLSGDTKTITDPSIPLASGPQTGDSIIPFVICGAMLVLGIGLIGLYIKLTLSKNKEVA